MDVSARSLRGSGMVVSLGLSLLLYISSFPPIFVGLFLSSLVSLFFYEMLGIVDPGDSLSFEINHSQGDGSAKVSGRFVGISALFLLIWILSTLVLTNEKRMRIGSTTELQPLLISSTSLPEGYILIKHPNPDILDKISHNTSIGRLNVQGSLNAKFQADPFDPILVRIRNDCRNGKGLCQPPIDWFQVQIDGVNKQLKGNRVSVCSGHDYLAGKLINFAELKPAAAASRPWSLDQIGSDIAVTNQPLKAITPDTPLEIDRDPDMRCNYNHATIPRIRISSQLIKPIRALLTPPSNTLYARIP